MTYDLHQLLMKVKINTFELQEKLQGKIVDIWRRQAKISIQVQVINYC